MEYLLFDEIIGDEFGDTGYTVTYDVRYITCEQIENMELSSTPTSIMIHHDSSNRFLFF